MGENRKLAEATHVNVIGKVEPGVGGEGGTPLLNATNVPAKVAGVRSEAVFQL